MMTDSVKKVGAAAVKLKALRKRLGVPTLALGQAVGGQSPSSYLHYEDRYKRDTLPRDKVLQMAPIFLRHGATPAELAELVGMPAGALDFDLAIELQEHSQSTRQSPQTAPQEDGTTLDRQRLREALIAVRTAIEANILQAGNIEIEADLVLRYYDRATKDRVRPR